MTSDITSAAAATAIGVEVEDERDVTVSLLQENELSIDAATAYLAAVAKLNAIDGGGGIGGDQNLLTSSGDHLLPSAAAASLTVSAKDLAKLKKAEAMAKKKELQRAKQQQKQTERERTRALKEEKRRATEAAKAKVREEKRMRESQRRAAKEMAKTAASTGLPATRSATAGDRTRALSVKSDSSSDHIPLARAVSSSAE